MLLRSILGAWPAMLVRTTHVAMLASSLAVSPGFLGLLGATGAAADDVDDEVDDDVDNDVDDDVVDDVDDHRVRHAAGSTYR